MALAPSLLITDDDVAYRETLQSVFEPMGFRTLLAGDGEEAVSILQKETVHLVLLDMHMPKLTGLETVRVVHKMQKRMPCILMSADLDDEIVAQAERENVCSVLAKPVTRRQITGAVNQALSMTYGWPVQQLSLRIRIVNSSPAESRREGPSGE